MEKWRIEYEKWLAYGGLTPDERAELSGISGDEGEIESRFCMNLQFGTAGLRGTMGMGTNRMNVYVIRHATQAFAETIREKSDPAKGVAICFDCRIGSELFAREAACVMAANGVPVKLFDAMRPTPELSFAIRHYGCAAGINITASHNPKEYNGYKVYWSDGAQLPPEPADAVARKMASLDIFGGIKTTDFDSARKNGMIELIGAETDDAFLENVMAQAMETETVAAVADSFKMVYTPFHGVGYKLIPEALRRLGIKNLYCEPEQMKPDGTFPTVASPNPENPDGFRLAAALADEVGADFVLGSDPDADRVAVMARCADGKLRTISGNRTGVLLLDYIINAKKRRGTLPENATALKTIVTTDLARIVAEGGGVKSYDTFTGFKFMAEKKNKLEETGEGKVIFSYEESIGYMLGDYVRDKDAVTASLVLTEMAAWYYSQGMTLYDALDRIFEKYGYFDEYTVNLVMPGLSGMDKMRALMDNLRAATPKEIEGEAVTLVRDYSCGVETDTRTGEKREMELRGSNVLSFDLADASRILVRPSGTEPKVKVYILARGESRDGVAAAIEKYSAWANALK